MMVPEADQVNTSICPGVSIKTYLRQGDHEGVLHLGNSEDIPSQRMLSVC